MVKLFILLILILIIIYVCKDKEEPENNQIVIDKESGNVIDNNKSLYYVCLTIGILAVIFATLHGISNLIWAPWQMTVTGGLALILLYAELIMGIMLHRNPQNLKLKTAMKIVPIIIVILVIFHVVTLRIGIFSLKTEIVNEVLTTDISNVI